MPSNPPPGSTGGSPWIPAPDSTGGTPRTPAPFQPAPVSTGGSSRTPAALSAQGTRPVTKKCTVLIDWCLERVEGEEGKIRVTGATYNLQMNPQMRKGASSSKGNRNVAGRVFRSSAIVKRLDDVTIESEDGYRIRIHNLLNIPKTRENGFSQEVCECFVFGFPSQWQSLVNPNMVPDKSPSEITTSAPRHSIEYYMEKLLSDSPYDFTESDFDSSVGYSGNTDGLTTQCLSNLLDDNAGNNICTSSQLGEPRIPKSGKDSVNLATTDALELPTEGMTPKFGAIRGSEDSTGRRLRSGKVLIMPSGGPMRRGHKKKEIQQEASCKQMVNQGTTSTSSNDFSTAEVVAEEKLESHGSCLRGRGRPAKGKGKGKEKRKRKGKEKRKRSYLVTN